MRTLQQVTENYPPLRDYYNFALIPRGHLRRMLSLVRFNLFKHPCSGSRADFHVGFEVYVLNRIKVAINSPAMTSDIISIWAYPVEQFIFVVNAYRFHPDPYFVAGDFLAVGFEHKEGTIDLSMCTLFVSLWLPSTDSNRGPDG